jgi:hypothetical protein
MREDPLSHVGARSGSRARPHWMFLDPSEGASTQRNGTFCEVNSGVRAVVRSLLYIPSEERDAMQTLIDIIELPLPAIERYRAAAPRMSLDLEIDYEDSDGAQPPSDRFLRARCWVSED